ncbi:MAG: hypothetical protein J1E81_03260 [Eubacterium sp.]|nr:hypothetical protein [Eubacterium sp.]
MKKINKIIVPIICITCIALGFTAGYLFNSKSINTEDAIQKENTSANNVISASSTTSKNEEKKNELPENELPFDLYKSFLVNPSGKIVDKVNDNPIDKIYYEKYINAKSLKEEQDVLADWIEAYENEFENAVDVFNSIVKEKSDIDSNISSSELVAIMDKYSDYCSDYTESTAKLAYGFEEFYLGRGTNHVYDLLLNSLELNRTNTLRVVECIYFLHGDYSWEIND